MLRSGLALVFVVAVADAEWKPFDGSSEAAMPGQGKGDCKGAATPVQSLALSRYVTIDECINWLNLDCQGPAGFADPRQPKCSQFGTATGLALKVGWATNPPGPSGQCRAWFKHAPNGQNGDKPWDCFVPDYAKYSVPKVFSLTVKNTASNGVRLMDASCKDDDVRVESGSQVDIPLERAHKYWVVPDGCGEAEGCFPCGSDCTGCFYIAPNVGNGVAVTGIGYGLNKPVKVHDGISGAIFSATNQRGRPDFVDCTTTSCNFNHIIQAHGDMTFTIEGSSSQSGIVV